MGLLDKLKNVFFEEEYVEVEEPEIKEKPKKVEKVKEKDPEKSTVARKIDLPRRVTREVIEEEELEEEEVVEKPKEILADRELLKTEPSFKMFEDDDFVEEKPVEKVKPVAPTPVVEPLVTKHVPYGGEYKTSYSNLYTKGEKDPKTFRPTPIISPIYGILDKNYSKDDIVDKKERKAASSYARKIDLDTVRKKAYGELSNDFGLSGEDAIAAKKEETTDLIEENLLYDMSDIDTTPAVEKVTIADAEEYFEDLGLEYNIDYKDKAQEKASGRRVRHSYDVEDSLFVNQSKPVKEEPVMKPNDQNLEDNLFDLIDSMYEDKE